MVGPVLFERIYGERFETLFGQLRMPPRLREPLRSHYQNVPTIPFPSHYESIMSVFARFLFENPDCRKIFKSAGDLENLRFHYGGISRVPEKPFLNIQYIEERYRAENAVLTAIGHGNETQAMESVKQCQSFQRRLALGYCRLVRKYSTSGYSLPVQKVITCITTDLSADLGLKALAGKLNVTPSYLSSLFRKETGMTLTDYVNQQRIAHAQHLLLNTSFPIKSIAQQCGIADLNYFVRMFKRAAGVTPKVYRDSAAHSQHLEIVRNHEEESPALPGNLPG